MEGDSFGTLSSQTGGGGQGGQGGHGRGGRGPGAGEVGGREPDGPEPFEHGPDSCEVFGYQADGLEPRERGPDGRELGAMTYWRRRFMALTVGLGVLSLIAWAFSGTIGAGRAGGGTAAGDARASHGHAPGTTADSGRPEGAASPAAQPTVAASAAVHATAGPAASAQPSASAPVGAQAGHAPAQMAAFAPHRAPHPARACKPGNVVISLFAGQDSYGPGQLPEFDVNVVSTAATTCAFDVGAKRLSLVVRAHGKRVWASAECAAGHAALTTNLTRGVPVIVPVSWNRQTSALSCQGTGRQVPAGRYSASASDGGVASNRVRFTIG